MKPVSTPRSPRVLALFLLAASGCTVVLPGSDAASGGEAGDDRSFERAIAAQRLEVAKLDQAQALADADGELVKSERDLAVAESELAHFDAVEAPKRRAEKDSALKASEDDLFEAEEELKQLEMLYKDEDLADKTREIVIQRSQRWIARAKEHLAIERIEKESLEKHELVVERTKLEREVDEKRRALAATKQHNVITALEKTIAVREAEQAVKKGKVDSDGDEDDAEECCGACGADADDGDDEADDEGAAP